ncbi:hypothetical protein SAMN05216223_12587 [Actinacidiphila yanglinensis]|uniref:Uncharacterized protein n=1 Tax=Actinacidiphila yanglinensis TaxID=310779 RepID=A0A1H6E3K6_9ACTN|nr:hypothetical protein [Actinacidiphila yanglinensis]SEG92220.1 hypothetical protein SAMN05216223_12587 [Actinacidiphila yanglinensis]
MVEEQRFVPAEFGLHEFDDGDVAAGGGAAARRWFSHWDGLIGAPAEEVHLGWAAAGSVVIVCTSGRRYDRAEARFRAAHLALGGDALPLAARPRGPLATHQAIDALANSEALWTRTGTGIAGSGSGPGTEEDRAETATADGFSMGYQRLGDVVVFVVAVQLDPARFRVRPVDDWSAYAVDARTGFPLSALKA